MRINYPDNSFMLSWQHCRAWFNPDGSLKDAEYKRGGNNVRSVSARHTKVRAWLDKQGAQEADLLKRGIVKRQVNNMYQLKPYQLVQVKRSIDGVEYISIGQTMSFPTPSDTIMVRMVPGHPGTLEELKLAQVEPLRSQTRRRWVHYARVKPTVTLNGSPLAGFPMDMLRRENAVAVNFNPETGERTEEMFLVAKVGEKSRANWSAERWLSFNWSLEEGHSERATPEMQ